ncbi:nucleotidyltransferase domain-containing protein [bacterium]|nr:nucleotidyltransferase domain-containing protein [bacterium]
MENPQSAHHVRELATHLEVDAGNLSRDLNKLQQLGLLNVVVQGRNKVLSLNHNHALTPIVTSYFKATQSIDQLIKNKLQTLPDIEQAFIYGSYAKNKMDQHSDIDVLIIGGVSALKVQKCLKPVELQTGREIHARILSSKEFANRKKKKDAFIQDVFGGNIVPVI